MTTICNGANDSWLFYLCIAGGGENVTNTQLYLDYAMLSVDLFMFS